MNLLGGRATTSPCNDPQLIRKLLLSSSVHQWRNAILVSASASREGSATMQTEVDRRKRDHGHLNPGANAIKR